MKVMLTQRPIMTKPPCAKCIKNKPVLYYDRDKKEWFCQRCFYGKKTAD